MRLEFRAVDGGFEDGGGDDPTFALVCGVSGTDEAGVEHYLNFQRDFEGVDPTDDWGVHFEFDDQINGAYKCVQRCRLTRNSLEVDLTAPIDWERKYACVTVDISGLGHEIYTAMRVGLPRIFRGSEGILELA